jgi:flagellar FliJ protein
MSQFVFSLEGVLLHRRRLEQQAQVDLARQISTAAGLRDELDRLNADMAAAAEGIRTQLASGSSDAGLLALHGQQTVAAARRATELMERLGVAEQAVESARLAAVAAAKERRVLEVLREKHEARWRAVQSRREQVAADETLTQMSFMSLMEPPAEKE